MRARDLVRLGVLTATHGEVDVRGWPAAEHIAYDWVPAADGVPHPADGGVLLGTVATSGDAWDAVVSLCPRGTAQVALNGVRPEDHLEVWLVDSDNPADSPNLDFVFADTAAAVAALRGEGRRVLLHCVAGEQRTPSAAVAYGVHLGQSRLDAARAVREVLPRARAHGLLWDRVRT
jgi:hypothetical protein